MWNSLSGEITRKGLEQVFLQSGDLEWDIAMGRFGLEALPPVGQRARVYVWLQHTEDSMRLFGFASVTERSLFLDLLKVSGVGPKLALKALSGMRHQDFAVALEAGDAARLSKVPGVGLKTAQKIILALQGKLILDDTAGPGADRGAGRDGLRPARRREGGQGARERRGSGRPRLPRARAQAVPAGPGAVVVGLRIKSPTRRRRARRKNRNGWIQDQISSSAGVLCAPA